MHTLGTSLRLKYPFLKVNEELNKLKDEIYHRDRFIDKFLPLQTVTFISDYMHYALDPAHRKRIAEFESMTLTLLNNSAISSEPIDSRNIKAEKILNEMKHVEERKVKLLTEHKENDPEPKPIKVAKVKKPEKAPEVHKIFTNTGPDLNQVEHLISEKISSLHSTLLKSIHDEISAKQESSKNYFRAIIDQNNNLLNQVLQDSEKTLKDLKSQISQLSKDSSKDRISLEELKKSFKPLEISQNFLTKLVVCLVENAQIEQALQAQDEEDRMNMVSNYEKDYSNDLALNRVSHQTPEPYATGLPSALAVQKKCLGCGGNSTLLSGVKTTVMYKPTPLIYRNRKFERNTLINFRGRMVKDCWEGVNKFIPWKQEDMESLVSETYKGFKNEEEQNVLPVLTSATRTRSYHHRKMKSYKGNM